jgi:hypothetical protein
MMIIVEEIRRCAVEYEMSTGINPTRVYLGRGEMKRLMQWAYNNQYVGEGEITAEEGDPRPEVNGLFVYEVNEDGPHMRCCA